jgi:hypothetical protein
LPDNNNGPLAFQIVSLGAGSDSRFFQFESLWKLKAKSASSLFKYYEIDFPEVTSKKARLIYRHKDLLEKLENPTISMFICSKMILLEMMALHDRVWWIGVGIQKLSFNPWKSK